ncbi:bifunctional 2-polyprenyl-6-hydroxyphenol methylase/3-demethylubiquinol 3-O-methyltransferase UbiG [Paenibacillus sp. CF384]|uniref:class I SAM-dependent methyltransferase n=1 Tax=Paenibacillus sp. CF384 TaxID=1884382 RepID=UPI00089A5CD3|nr:class I SAM-dependent methyltransferase [Paenibacillus sp. CF384]SDX20718.1 Methyltransferase domain-containing protein [Paenibacillus sp. CF384]
MEHYYWDEQIAYLKRSASLYYNDDYIQFLIERVWKIDSPVNIIDYGCGFGHLGLRLMPLLPSGSTYSGIDAGSKLIDHARALFNEAPYDTEFMNGDFLTYKFEKKYDIALCHAVLLHMTDPMQLLRKMIDCVKKDGKIITFEPHWNGNHAGFYLEGVDQSRIMPLGLLQELFERDVKCTGKDGNIGAKLPLYFNQLGLRQVECRVSDRVNVLDPTVDDQNRAERYEAMRFSDPGERETYIRNLLLRGMQLDEAERQYEAERLIASAFTSTSAAAYAPGMRITFGTVQ